MITQRWAALINGQIVKIGMQLACYRFDRRVFHFSNEGFARWVVGGAWYCKVTDDAQVGDRIQDVEHHGRIRQSKDIPCTPVLWIEGIIPKGR